jgi:cytoskeletal protein CcmA (bactofilin family)
MASTTVIAAGTVVRGHVLGREDVQVLGRVEGTVLLEAAITVEADARVDATVEATHVRVHGTFVGRIVARESIELTAGARVQAELVTPRLVIQDGALFAGQIDMGEVPTVQAGAPRAASPAAPAPRPAPAASSPAPSFPRPAAVPAPVVPTRPVMVAPAPAPAPALAPEPEDDDDPELPDAAGRKNVTLKKKK